MNRATARGALLALVASIALTFPSPARADFTGDKSDDGFKAAALVAKESFTPVPRKQDRPRTQTGSQGNRPKEVAANPSLVANPIKNIWKALQVDRPTCASDRARNGCAQTALSCGQRSFTTGILGRNEKWQAQQGERLDTRSGARSSLGYRCVDTAARPKPAVAPAADPAAPGAPAPAPEPVVVVVTQSDFASLPVAPAVAHAGPPSGYLPVNMDLIAYAESQEQTLDTVLLGTPVQVRATPVEYRWDFGDGNTITTHTPGRPYPAKDIVNRYEQEGWYDITLSTTYTGQYSVAGGPWEDIDGTVTIDSAPVSIYSRSFESHLVDPDADPGDVDDEQPAELPPRTPDNQGPRDSHPRNG